MTIAVTGATGHVGANLVRTLLIKSNIVRVVLHKNRQAVQGLDVEVVEGDVCNLYSLQKAFEGADVVYNLAAYISLSMNEWQKCKSINVIGTRNVVEACLLSGVRRLVHFSSIHALEQKPEDVPVDEMRSLVISHNHPPYDCSKADGEREVLKGIEKGLNAIIINPTGIIGPHDYYPSHFGQVLLSLACGKLLGLINGGFDWVDVRDVVKGAMQAEKLAPMGAKYLLSGHWASMRTLSTMIDEILAVEPPNFVCPMWLADIGAPFATALARLVGKRPLYTRVSMAALHGNRNISHDKATRELGYCPRPLRETLVDTIRWFEQNGQLTCSKIKKSERAV
jgi:dihydroflavonol-4-reductase